MGRLRTRRIAAGIAGAALAGGAALAVTTQCAHDGKTRVGEADQVRPAGQVASAGVDALPSGASGVPGTPDAAGAIATVWPPFDLPQVELIADPEPPTGQGGTVRITATVRPNYDLPGLWCTIYVEDDMEVLDGSRIPRGGVNVPANTEYQFDLTVGLPTDDIRRSSRLSCSHRWRDNGPHAGRGVPVVVNPNGRRRVWTRCTKPMCEHWDLPVSLVASAKPSPGKTVDLELRLLFAQKPGRSSRLTIVLPPGVRKISGSLDSNLEGDGATEPVLHARVRIAKDATGSIEGHVGTQGGLGWQETAVKMPIEGE